MDQKQYNKNKDEECPLCDVSEESLKQLRAKSRKRKKPDKKKKRGKKKSSPSKKGFFRKLLAGISIAGGVIAAALGVIGALGWCCVPVVVGILAAVGISGGILMAYNQLFLGVSIILVGVGAVLLFRWCRGEGVKKKLYQCPECKLWYKEKKWAEKCKAWCRKHQTCNIEIANHAQK